MLVSYIALLPEAILSFGIILMSLIGLFRTGNTPKTFYTFSKWLLLTTMLITVVFYNQKVEGWLENNNYTTLFKFIIYILNLAWCSLSLKRFQSRNVSSFGYYLLILLNMLGFSLAISARSLWLLCASLVPCLLLNYRLFKIDNEEEKQPRFRRYLAFAVVFSAFLIIGTALIHYYAGSAEYSNIKTFLQEAVALPWQCELAFVLIMVFFFFALGLAPFHFWFADAVSSTILPVGGYLTVIPIFAYFSCMMNVVINAFYPLHEWFLPVMLIFGVLSIFIGAVGANSEDNLCRIFAYASLYYTGVLIVSAAGLNEQSLLGAFIYLLVYALAIFGIYTVLFGCRSKGEYLYNLSDIRGLSTQRPFLSAAILIFMISLIGSPPLLGFLGKLSVINSLVVGGSYGLMAIIAFSMLILVYAYLKIITVIYFEPRNISFDRVDKGVYIYLAINMLLIIMTILNPKYLMHDVEIMLVAIL